MVAKGTEAKKVIKNVETLQQQYNELNHLARFESQNDFKALQTDHVWLTRDYGKMEVVNVQ